MAYVNPSIQIEKLNDKNYAVWKFKAEMLLIKENVADLIYEAKPETPDDSWFKRDRIARSIICLNISDSQIIHVLHENTAKDTWDKLKSIHERANLSNKIFLLRKLYSIKYKDGTNMNDHIREIFELVERLNSIGETIKDSHLSALLLCSLPESYSALITALESRPESEISAEYVKNKLIDEYERRTEINKNAESSRSLALKGNFVKQNIPKVRKFCTYCHKSNHLRHECWHLIKRDKQNVNQNKSERKDGKNYHKQQHKLSVCTQDQRETTQNKQNISGENESTRKENYVLKLDSSTCSDLSTRDWIIDSGATSHMTGDIKFFSKLNKQTGDSVTIANGVKLQTQGIGEGSVTVNTLNGKTNTLQLKDVLYIPELDSNLMSVKTITSKGYTVIFKENICTIEKENKIVANAIATDSLFKICELAQANEKPQSKEQIKKCTNANCIMKWHERLGHRSVDCIKQIENKNLANGIKVNNCKHDMQCSVCIKAKLSEMPYPKKAEYRAKHPLDLIHTDVCGPMEVNTLGGKRYFVTFIDDFSRYTMIYLLAHKDEVFSKLKEYIASTTNKFRRKIKTIRSDNGGEYCNKQVEEYLTEQGISHQTTVPYSPAQNGVAERKNRTIMDMSRAMLINANLAKSFWGEAVTTAVYVQNRLPTKATEKSPYELWNGTKPNLSHIKTFGCKAYMYVNKQNRNKLDDKAVEGTFLGYDFKSKGYRIHTGGRNVKISRTVKFLEDVHGRNNKAEEETSTTTFDYFQINEEKSLPEEADEQESESDHESHTESQTLRRSERSTKGKPPDRLTYKAKENPNISINANPKSLDEINQLSKNEREKWKTAMQNEVNSLNKNKTWKLVDLPRGKKVINSKWIFKTKYDENGREVKCKARLVAKGYDQRFGTDYDETFAPVVKHTTIRAFFATAIHKKMKINHVDVKTAFLYGKLEEEIYMAQPEGFEKKGEEDKVCKLQKAIYGLKQSAKAWNEELHDFFLKQSFQQSKADPCLYTKGHGTDAVFIIIYVDDILISSKNEGLIQEVISGLKEIYEISDLGEAKFFLGIEIFKDKNGNYFLSQENKIQELTERYHMEDAKPTYTPLETNYYQLEDEKDLLPNNELFRQAVGALLYISTVSRPDIAAATHILSRRCQNPRQQDWNAIKRIIRYLKTTKNLKLKISSEQKPVLQVFVDADWGQDRQDRKSTSGNVFLLGQTPLSWKSAKQNCVSLSSTEAEYVSLAQSTQELLWILSLLKDLQLEQTLPITIFEDNQATIKLSQSGRFNARNKHIDIKYHHLQDLRKNKVILLDYCSTDKMLADIMTKPLAKPRFESHRRNLNLEIPFAPSILKDLHTSGGLMTSHSG